MISFTPEIIFQLIISSVLLGMLYSLIGVGLSLVLGSLDVLNISHGAFYMLGGYVALGVVLALNVPIIIGLVIAILTIFLVGLATEFATVEKVKADANRTMILTMGIAVLLGQLALLLQGGTFKTLPPIFQGVVGEGGYFVPLPDLLAALVALAIAVALHLFLSRSKVGKAIRMIAFDRETSVVLGINVSLISMLTFGIGSAAAGVAGVLLSSKYPLFPDVGWSILAIAFIVTVLGGVESIKGNVAAGIAYALVANIVSLLLPRYGVISGLFFVIAVLLLKPAGLFGKLSVEKA